MPEGLPDRPPERPLDEPRTGGGRAVPGPAADGRAGPWQAALRRLARNRAAMIALGVVLALSAAALLAPLLTPYDFKAQPDAVAMKNLPPSGPHPFGTDQFSRDVYTRVLYGARVSLSVAFLATLLAVTLGTAYGAVAGYAGGRVDGAMMRIVDALLAVPRLLLVMTVAVLWGTLPLLALVALIGATGWFGLSRLVRGQVRAVSRLEYVASARALGAPASRILVRHVLPNVISPVVVAATLGIGNVIILEAGLSFLGVGVQQPFASWGNIINDGADQIATLWWISLFPGLAIVVTVTAFNILGDGLREALDPRGDL